MNEQGDIEALMHRPLREGQPWNFHGLEGVSEESLQITNGQCVAHQLSAALKIKGHAQFSRENIIDMLQTITEDLYDDEDLRDPKVGFTAAAIVQLCKEVECPIHIKWGSHKVVSYQPENAIYDNVALYIWGDHCFTVGDTAVTKRIMREPITEMKEPEEFLLARIGRKNNATPSSQFWDTYTTLQPGYFLFY